MCKIKILIRKRVLQSLYPLSLVSILLAGCSLALSRAAPPPDALQAQTPDQAARQSMSLDSGYTFLAQRPLQNKMVVFHRYAQPAMGANIPAKGFGYTVVVQEGNQWSVRGGGGTSGQLAGPQAEAAFGVLDVMIEGNGPTYAAVLGDVQQVNVSRAKVQFTDGSIRQEAVVDGVFVIMAAQPNIKACQLQVLGESEQVIGQYKLGDC